MVRFRVAERGQVLPLVAAVLVLAGALTLVVARLSGAAVDRARARTAADAAALAGAAEGEVAARSVAAANGGDLVSYRPIGRSDVEVVVRLARATATARARRERGAGSWRSAGIRAGSPANVQGSGGSASPLRRAPP
jgi:hypothetical protein